MLGRGVRTVRNYLRIGHRRCLETSSEIFDNPRLLAQLDRMKERYGEVTELMSSTSDPGQLRRLGKEYAELGRGVELIVTREECLGNIEELEGLLNEEGEGELAELAQEELKEAEQKKEEMEESLVALLTPKDDADDRGVVVEVRSGTGGDEASLFASEIFRMYQRYSANQGWGWEELNMSTTDIGGFKAAQAVVSGDAVFERLKYESGVHRVQRVPVNDKRIHTSAANVVMLPEAEDVDVELRKEDLQIDVFRASGAGGQSVNKTESAVRITHLPTGCSVSMQDERCQHQNREKAMRILRARVYDMIRREAEAQRSQLVSAAGSTGARTDKIRTYNFPQDRITDHRVNLSVTGVERVLDGENLDTLVEALLENDKKSRLERFLDELTTA